MDSQTRVTLLVIVQMTLYFVAIRGAFWRFLTPLPRRVMLVLAVLQTAWGLSFLATRGDYTFAGWFFNPGSEGASGAIFSSLLLLAISVTAALNGLRRDPDKPSWHRLPWLVLAAVFFSMAIDEYYAFHETHTLWRQTYTVGGVLLGVMGIGMYILERDIRIPLAILIGFGCIGFGGVALDAYANEAELELGPITVDWFMCYDTVYGIVCQQLSIIEELLELIGESIILAGFLSYAQDHHTAGHWRLTRRALAGAAAIWLVWTISSVWVIPPIQAKLMAEPVDAEWLDGALRLESYHLSPETAHPGDNVTLTLYFRANRVLTWNYFLSVHLLSHPEVDSLAQADEQLGEWTYPSSAWIPGLAVRTTVHLTLPDDTPTPASYWVAVRVWAGPQMPGISATKLHAHAETPVGQTDRPLIAPHTIRLYALPVLDGAPAAPPARVTYRFDNGITLYGIDLPTAAQPGGSLALGFWWQTRRAIDQPLTHFLHLIAEDGTLHVFDHQTFDDRFPMADWPQGLDAADTWTITLPEDLPPGEYRAYTGIYQSETVARIPVQDADGQPVPDALIDLGPITVGR